MSHLWMKLACHLQSPLEIGSQVVNNLVPVHYPQWGLLAQIMKIQGWGELFQAPYWSHWGSCSLSQYHDAESQSCAKRQLAGKARGCRKSGVIWWGGSAEASVILGPWEVIPPVEVSGSAEELVTALVMILASGLGTPEPRGEPPPQQQQAGWHEWLPRSGLSPPVPTWVSHSGGGDPSLSEIRGRKVALVGRQNFWA